MAVRHPVSDSRRMPLAELFRSGWKRLQRVLARGGIVVYPTDTLYGLGGDFYNPAVHQRIDGIKGRSDRPYSVALWDRQAADSLIVDPPPWFLARAHRLLPGPFTCILRPAPGIPVELLRGGAAIGIRIPADPFPRPVMARLGIPLVTTSVNRTGAPPLADPAEILVRFPEIDLLIDAGTLPPSPGSTVLDLTGETPIILRPGAGRELLAELGIR